MIIGGPRPPISPLARVQIPTINVDATKVYGWNSHGILVVSEQPISGSVAPESR
jgi:hypothetical protein